MNTLDYLRLSLQQYCREDFPDLLKDSQTIERRSQEALAVYLDAIKNYSTHIQAIEIANETLFQGLNFSKVAFVRNIIEEEFLEHFDNLGYDIQQKSIEIARLEQELFELYPADENGIVENEMLLYTEMTGAISEWLNNRHE